MRNFGINLAIGFIIAYLAYQLGAWRERRWHAGFRKRSEKFAEDLKYLNRRENDK